MGMDTRQDMIMGIMKGNGIEHGAWSMELRA